MIGHDDPDTYATVNRVLYSAYLIIHPAGYYRAQSVAKYGRDRNTGEKLSVADAVRRTPWGERPNHTAEGWECNSFTDKSMRRRDSFSDDVSEAAREKYVSGTLAAAAAFLATDEGRALVEAGAKAERINTANRHAEKIAKLNAEIAEERKALRKLARHGIHPDD
jgi:hypothetical protein